MQCGPVFHPLSHLGLLNSSYTLTAAAGPWSTMRMSRWQNSRQPAKLSSPAHFLINLTYCVLALMWSKCNRTNLSSQLPCIVLSSVIGSPLATAFPKFSESSSVASLSSSSEAREIRSISMGWPRPSDAFSHSRVRIRAVWILLSWSLQTEISGALTG